MTTPPYDQDADDLNDKQVNHYGYRPIDPNYQRWEIRFVIGLIALLLLGLALIYGAWLLVGWMMPG